MKGETRPVQLPCSSGKLEQPIKLVHRPRALAPLADRPHDERLAAPHVTGGEDLRHRFAIRVGVGLDVAASVFGDVELRQQSAVVWG